MNKKSIKISLLIALILIIFLINALALINNNNLIYMNYKDFYEQLENGNIETAVIKDNKVEFKEKDDDTLYFTENPNYDNFKENLLLNGVQVEVDSSEESINFAFDILFYLFFFGIIIFAIAKLVKLNHNTFKVVRHTKIKFENIAGMEDLKKEMMKAVEILKNPDKFKQKGIRQTKGIILEGNPGNGKTLFSKALAEEADVSFIATKGADFQSAMMSIGARKIKMLFKKARRHKPCIIFIDEFDGIGERRNYAGTGVDKENNRIITAMLNEMDGFESEDGILVIAATNSYLSLDPALIRPGRFDLKYNIPNPDFDTRLKLIDLYTTKKVLEQNIDKQKLANAFENFGCSAIETILNEASMLAILENHEEISLDNIIEAGKKTNCNINMKKYSSRN